MNLALIREDLPENFSVWFTCRWWREHTLFLLSLRVRAPGHLLLPLVSRYLDYLMLLVSKIIAQGVCQRGVGPSYFSKPVAMYLITGDHIAAMNHLSTDDASLPWQSVINQVNI